MFIKLKDSMVYDTEFTMPLIFDWDTGDNQEYFDNVINAFVELYESRQRNVARNCVLLMKWWMTEAYNVNIADYFMDNFARTKYKEDIEKYLVLL